MSLLASKVLNLLCTNGKEDPGSDADPESEAGNAEANLGEEAIVEEDASVAEEAIVEEEASVAEEASLAEEARVAEEASVEEEASVAEETRVAEEASVEEEVSVAEEATVAEEEASVAEEKIYRLQYKKRTVMIADLISDSREEVVHGKVLLKGSAKYKITSCYLNTLLNFNLYNPEKHYVGGYIQWKKKYT